MKKQDFKKEKFGNDFLSKTILYGMFLEMALFAGAIIAGISFLFGGNGNTILVILDIFLMLIIFYAVILFILYVIKLNKDKKEKIKINTMALRRKGIKELTLGSLIFGIIIAMTFVPNMGYITVAGIAITIIHIPVLIGAALLGWKWGLFLEQFLELVHSFKHSPTLLQTLRLLIL